MKAIVYQKYGSPDVLELQEVATPTPKNHEVRIKVNAATVTPADWRARSLKVPSPMFWLPSRMFFGLIKPKRTILGTELAGVIDAVGKDVRQFKSGDKVFAFPGVGFGAHAEYICMAEHRAIATKPPNMSFDEAAAVPFGALTALYFLRDKGDIRRGHNVLIHGASGGVGTFAVQLAKYFGAHVTGVCSSVNVDMVRSLGADRVYDYTKEDFTQNDRTYDIIFDTVGKTSFSRCKNSLAPNGRYLAAVLRMREIFQIVWTSLIGGKKVIGGVATERKEDLRFLKELIEAGKITAVIDRSYALEQIAEAHRYVEKGHKKGNVVVTLVEDVQST